MPEPFRLDGETALITGGGSGLGFGIAEAFARSGARVLIAGRRLAVLEEAASKLDRAVTSLELDVTNYQALDQTLSKIAEQVAPITILVNNAGVHLKKAAVDTAESEFLAIMETHVTAAFALSRRVARTMLERRHGSILFMASMTSFMGLPFVPAYSAAKSAHLGLVRSLAAELGPSGVRVNAIAPGWIQTPMLEKSLQGDTERRNKILSRTPLGHFGSPEDIAWAAVYLCSPAAKFVNGVVLPIDGGASIGF